MTDKAHLHGTQTRAVPAEIVIVPLWVSAEQAATLVLGISLRTFWDQAKEPGFPAGKQFRKALRWRTAELNEWMEQQLDTRPGELQHRKVERVLDHGREEQNGKRREEAAARAQRREDSVAPVGETAAAVDEPSESTPRHIRMRFGKHKVLKNAPKAPESKELAHRRADRDAGREVLPAPFNHQP
jgi:predicted DNA-binding transcriptional regulator AlpA